MYIVKNYIDISPKINYYIATMKLNIKKINQELKRLKWTKAEYARQMGIVRQQANYYFKSEINSMKIVERMAKPLNLNPKDLIL